MSGDDFCHHIIGGATLQSAAGDKPGMLLNIQKGTGWPRD